MDPSRMASLGKRSHWRLAALALLLSIAPAASQGAYLGPTCYEKSFPQCTKAEMDLLKNDKRWYGYYVDAVLATFQGKSYKESMINSVRNNGTNISDSCAACEGEYVYCSFRICAADGAKSPCAKQHSDACLACGALHCAESMLCGLPREDVLPPLDKEGNRADWILKRPLATDCGVVYEGPNKTLRRDNGTIVAPVDHSEEAAVQIPVALWSFFVAGACLITAALLLVMGFPWKRPHQVCGGEFGRSRTDGHTVRRAALAVCACCSVMALLAMGQGMISFVVLYNVGGNRGRAFEYDFWGGVVELWVKDSVLLSLIVGLLSGIWPFIKQIMTIVMVSGCFSRSNELRGLDWLGVMGKTAFIDIGIVTIIIAVIHLDQTADNGSELFFATIPKRGTWLIMLSLILSRVISSALIHYCPPRRRAEIVTIPTASSSSEESSDGPDLQPMPSVAQSLDSLPSEGARAAAGPVRAGLTWLLAVASPVLVVLGAVLPAVGRNYTLTVLKPGGGSTVLAEDSESLTLWEVVDRCGSDEGPEKVIRVALSSTVLLFANVFGLIFAFMPLMFLLLYRHGGRSAQLERLAASMQIMGEWSSLDPLCIGILVLPSQLKKLCASMSEDFGYDKAHGSGGLFHIDIDLLAGFWCSFIGSVLTLVAGKLARRYPEKLDTAGDAGDAREVTYSELNIVTA